MTRRTYSSFRGPSYLTLLLLLVSLVSCCPAFKNPLPLPPEPKADNTILGTWVRAFKPDEQGSREQLSIFARSSGWIDVVFIYDIDTQTSADGVSVLTFEGYSTSVNDQRFLCLRLRAKDLGWLRREDRPNRGDQQATESPFFIFNYQTPSSDKLTITFFSTLKVGELIKKGKLKGEADRKGMLKGILFNGKSLEEVLNVEGFSLEGAVVTSSSDELAKVISREGVGAFLGEGEDYIHAFSRGPYQPTTKADQSEGD